MLGKLGFFLIVLGSLSSVIVHSAFAQTPAASPAPLVSPPVAAVPASTNVLQITHAPDLPRPTSIGVSGIAAPPPAVSINGTPIVATPNAPAASDDSTAARTIHETSREAADIPRADNSLSYTDIPLAEANGSFEGTMMLNSHPNYTAEVSSRALEDLQEFRNCVQYEFCSITTSAFSQAGNLFVLKTGKFSAQQLSQIVNRCPLGSFKAKVVFKDAAGNAVATPSTVGANFDAYYANRSVQYLNPASVASIRDNARNLNRLMEDHHYPEALASDVSHAELDTLGYKVVYDYESNFAGAVTLHDIKEIHFGPGSFGGLEACQLTRMLRHEVDHVHQVARANACKARGTPSELDDHIQRELSAHLNDAINVGKYCASGSWSRGHVKFLVGVAKDYIRQMGAGNLN